MFALARVGGRKKDDPPQPHHHYTTQVCLPPPRMWQRARQSLRDAGRIQPVDHNGAIVELLLRSLDGKQEHIFHSYL